MAKGEINHFNAEEERRFGLKRSRWEKCGSGYDMIW